MEPACSASFSIPPSCSRPSRLLPASQSSRVPFEPHLNQSRAAGPRAGAECSEVKSERPSLSLGPRQAEERKDRLTEPVFPSGYLDKHELVGLGVAGGAGLRRFAELDAPAYRAEIELGFGQVLALLDRLKGLAIQPGMDFLDL